MSTRIYGASDDLIEFEGDFTGETGCHAEEDDDNGALVIVSDGTLLEVKYGKDGQGIWEVKLLKRGSLFDGIEQQDDPEAEIYSDIATFGDGVKWAYVASEWESVK